MQLHDVPCRPWIHQVHECLYLIRPVLLTLKWFPETSRSWHRKILRQRRYYFECFEKQVDESHKRLEISFLKISFSDTPIFHDVFPEIVPYEMHPRKLISRKFFFLASGLANRPPNDRLVHRLVWLMSLKKLLTIGLAHSITELKK